MQTFERSEILRDLRLGVYDVVVGINLLREGLDLPEVTLVAILDADKEGFLRSDTSLSRPSGAPRATCDGKVIMYADNVTDSMKRAIDETNRRRARATGIQHPQHEITPMTIVKDVRELLNAGLVAEEEPVYYTGAPEPGISLEDRLAELEKKMKLAAKALKLRRSRAACATR